MGLPVLPRSSSCMHAATNTPAEPLGVRVARYPNDDSLPRICGGSASALRFSRPAQCSLTLQPAYLPSHFSWPSTPEASAASLPPRLPRLLPAGATVAGRDSHPLKDRAFARRTHKQRKRTFISSLGKRNVAEILPLSVASYTSDTKNVMPVGYLSVINPAAYGRLASHSPTL